MRVGGGTIIAFPSRGGGPCACRAPLEEEVLAAEAVDKKPRVKVRFAICTRCRFSWILEKRKA